MIIRIPTATGSTSQFLAGDMEWRSASATPGGSTTQIQFNNAGAFGGDANFTWDTGSGAFYASGGGGFILDSRGAGTTIGDQAGSGNGTKLVIDDASRDVAFTCLDFSADAGTNSIICSSGVVTLGDYAAAGSSTTITIDDPNKRLVFGTANTKPVFSSHGGIYLYDTGTSTYWQWQSVSGTWTGTDTGSGSLP